jgi:hypothetical protein
LHDGGVVLVRDDPFRRGLVLVFSHAIVLPFAVAGLLGGLLLLAPAALGVVHGAVEPWLHGSSGDGQATRAC